MNIRQKSFLAVMALAATSIAPAITLAETNDPGPGMVTRVDKVSVDQMGKVPMLQVFANGNAYDTVTNTNMTVMYSAGVTCKSLWDVHYLEAVLGEGISFADVYSKKVQNQTFGLMQDTIVPWGVDSGEKEIYVTGRSLSGPVPAQVKQAAINVCNAEAQKVANQQNISVGKAMSEARAVNLPKSGWLAENFRLQAWTTCSKPSITNESWFFVYDGAPTIRAQCNAKPYSEGIGKDNMPNQMGNAFMITDVALSASQTSYTGSCPKKITLFGEVTANQAGSTEYQWSVGNAVMPAIKMDFTKAQTRKIKRELTIEEDYDRTWTLRTKGPGQKMSNALQINVNCTAAASSELKLAPSDPKPPIPPLKASPVPSGKKSDLTPGETITIGNQTGNWGSTLAVSGQSSTDKRGSACGFRMVYPVKNIGSGDAANAFQSRLFTDSTLHTGTINELGAGQSRNVSGTIYLPNGDHTVRVFVDHSDQEPESNEQNNENRILVQVTDCGEQRSR